jgi:hypothetical protein
MDKPLCFIVMPFGEKKDSKGRMINFDAIYKDFIKIAVEKAGLEPIRADEELTGGTIHKPMFERLILCEFAIADLTSLNANVFYELGLRHAIRGKTTIPIFAFDADIPFDLTMERTIHYKLDDDGKLVDTEDAITRLTEKIVYCRKNPHTDSPVFQLIDDFKVTYDLPHEKTDVFRKQAEYNNQLKDELYEARNDKDDNKGKVVAFMNNLDNISERSSGVVIDLYLSLRAVKAHKEMVDLYELMDKPLQKTKMVREQLGFALNRIEKRKPAEKVLKEIIEEYGPDPETNGLLGRVYKDLYNDQDDKNAPLAKAYLNRAIQSYKDGFDADWRDAFPGVNLVTLAEIAGNRELVKEYLPVVEFSAKRRMNKPDYWDVATLSELNVIAGNIAKAKDYLFDAITYITDKEFWMLESTLNNFNIIKEVREARGEEVGELTQLINEMKS